LAGQVGIKNDIEQDKVIPKVCQNKKSKKKKIAEQDECHAFMLV